MTLRRRVAEKMGYKAEPINGGRYWHLLDPQGNLVPYPHSWFLYDEEDAWNECCPPFDTWEDVGLVLKWLIDRKILFHVSIGDYIAVIGHTTVNLEDFPVKLCEYILEE